MNDREIALANKANFRPVASRVECEALSPSHQVHWPLATRETAGLGCVEFLDGERFHRNS
jgi:hypothetical protein